MKSVKKPLDWHDPEVRTLHDKIVHGSFINEGMMVAFPMCFPGVTVPIIADESRVTALDATREGVIYGGTSGKRVHLFVGMFRADMGAVYDMGVVDGAEQCVAVGCGPAGFAAFVNGPAGARIVSRELERAPFSLIQEWGFTRKPLKYHAVPTGGERIVHAVTDPSGRRAFATTLKHLLVVEIETGAVEVVGELRGMGRLAVDARGAVLGFDEGDTLWRFDPAAKKLDRRAIALSNGDWAHAPKVWARRRGPGLLYTADGKGDLFALDEAGRFTGPLGRAGLTPVGPMAVTLDGRVFGFCGDEISRMFCYDPDTGKVTDIGAAVSVIQRRRYGYVFGDAVVGRDGEIVFGEDDDSGHLWLYFPRIVEKTAAGRTNPQT